MNTTHNPNPKAKAVCNVCGAHIKQIPHNGIDTCDGICSRAKSYGRTRGKQMEIEVRAANASKPTGRISIDGATGMGYRSDNEYNRPYNWASM